MAAYRRPDPPAAPGPVPSLADHARAWLPPEDPGLAIDRAINQARSVGRIRRDEDGADRPLGEVVNAEVVAWNAAHPVGQAVVVFRPDGTVFRARTTSPACLGNRSRPAVGVSVLGLSAGYWPLNQVSPVAELPDAPAAAAESERPGVLPVAPGPEREPEPDALAVLCRELGAEFLALAAARRDGTGWDAGHWRRLRGAVEAAGAVLDAGPGPGRDGAQP
jgi:hypothetical protein